MEKFQIEPLYAQFNITPRTRSHLQSETYANVIRILSHCYSQPHLCKIPHITPAEAEDVNGAKEVCDNGEFANRELVARDGDNSDELLAKNDVPINEGVATEVGVSSDVQAVINGIENMLGMGDDVDPFEENNPMVDGDIEVLDDKGLSELQELLIDKFEDVMNGNEVVPDKNCNFSTFSSETNQGSDVMVAGSNHQDKKVDPQPIFIEYQSRIIGKTTNSSLDKSSEKSSLPRLNNLGMDCVMRQTEMESVKSASTGDVVGSSNLIKDDDLEEGELAGPFVVNDAVVDAPSKDSAVPQEQNKQLHGEVVDKNKCSPNDKKERNEKGSGSHSTSLNRLNITAVREAEAKDVRNGIACKRKVIVYEDPILTQEPDRHNKQKRSSENKEPRKGSFDKGKKKGKVSSPVVSSNKLQSPIKKLDQGATERQSSTSKEKPQQEASLCNKKKRRPLTEESKKRKKQKDRKRRAQKNRELGVKRLKLRPIENPKPKPVSICRHYIKGRCQEGEGCKFSHDVIPLTKSAPCCHFARNSCLKGDNCPFDHQLSKYSCTNYASTGYCIRGRDCLFSHKVPLKEDLPSSSNVYTPDMKPPSCPPTSNSKKQLASGGTPHLLAKPAPGSGGGMSHKEAERNVPVPKSVPSAHVQVPKGITFLSAGKSTVQSSKSTPGSSSPMRNEWLKATNQTNQSLSSTTAKSNEIAKTTPAAVIPKGINFLSFGKHTKQSSDIQIGQEPVQSVSNSTPWLNRIQPKTDCSPLKANALSFGESSLRGSIGNVKDDLPSSSSTLVDQSVQASENSPDTNGKLKTVTQGQRASPLGMSQTVDYLAHGCLQNTPHSSQKALMATLAFAAKVGSQMKPKQSTVSALAGTNNAGEETDSIGTLRVSQNNSVKASKILDFLNSVGKLNQ